MQTNVDIIYQQHILPLSRGDKLRLMAEISNDLANGREVAEPAKKRSLMELEGLGAEIWEGINPDEYVNELRDEWEPRP